MPAPSGATLRESHYDRKGKGTEEASASAGRMGPGRRSGLAHPRGPQNPKTPKPQNPII